MATLNALAVTGMAIGAPARPLTTFDPIKVYAFETRTGRVAASVPFVGQPRFTGGLNQAGGWSVTVPLNNPEVDSSWLSGITDPQRFSWAVAQGSYIWQAGPVIAEDYQGGTTTQITGGGIWKFLTDSRVLVNPNRAVLSRVSGADADVAFGNGSNSTIGSPIPPANRFVSLHTIAKRIVQTICSAPGGDLPMAYPADIAGTAERTYPGYDLASPGQRLTELSQVIGGPEIEFRPEFVDEVTRQQIQWRMRIGNPRLGNLGYPHVFDLGAALVDMTYATDGTGRATRAFERGNGMNRDLPVGFYDAPINTDPAALLLEQSGGTHTDVSDTNTLNAWASSVVQTNLVTKVTASATVRVPGDDGRGRSTRSPSMMEVAAGDTCAMHLRGHPRIPDSTVYARVLGVNSTDKAQIAQLQLQVIGGELR